MPRSSTDRRHFIIVAILVLLGTVVMDWLLVNLLPLPVQASTQAVTVDRLFRWHLLLISFLFSLVVVFMLYSLFVFRRRVNDTSEGEHFEGNTTLEIIWTVAPLLLVLVFGFFGVVTLNTITRAASNELVVKVEGFQWAWTFEYPNGVISPEMVIPVERGILVEMKSRDVNHSFWVPEFRVKQDLLPGQVTELRFTPTEVGDYKVRCSELCGRSHYSMETPVRVVTGEEYDRWLAEKTAQQGLAPALADAPSSLTE